jgi:hypothetical protein
MMWRVYSSKTKKTRTASAASVGADATGGLKSPLKLPAALDGLKRKKLAAKNPAGRGRKVAAVKPGS